VTFVLVLQKIPFGNKIPSSGKLKLITSPVGTSAKSKVVPEFDVVVSSKTPAPLPSEAIIIPLNLTGGSIIAVAPAAAADLVACISFLNDICFSLYFMWGRSPTLIIYYAANANAPLTAKGSLDESKPTCHKPSSVQEKYTIDPIVKKFVVALAAVKTKEPSPAVDVS